MRFRALAAFVSTCALASALAIGCSTRGAPRGGGDASVDAAIDGGPLDVHCTMSVDCEHIGAGNEVCDLALGACVLPCTLPHASCSPDHYCDEARKTCMPGCANDDACGSGKSGTTTQERRCNQRAHRCVECLDDVDCPPDSVCRGGQCALGCSDAEPCTRGEICCAGGCVDPNANVAHCGACGVSCENVSNGAARCRDGGCMITSCTDPWMDCDGDASNGCEVDAQTDAQHCGACNVACSLANADAVCSGGRCHVTACHAPYIDCDSDSANGCETNSDTSIDHCGGCLRPCAPRDTSACEHGVCGPTSCTGTLRDCDEDPLQTCETDTASNVNHCGGCGRACAPAHASARCASGSCQIVTCDTPFADCDGDAANGCETNLQTDRMHCSSCLFACGFACNSELVETMALPPSDWVFVQDAVYDAALGSAVLSPLPSSSAGVDGKKTGALIYSRPIVIDSFVLTFDFRISNEVGATAQAPGMGMAFMLENNGAILIPQNGLSDLLGLGVSGYSGYAIELFTTDEDDVPPTCPGETGDHVSIAELPAPLGCHFNDAHTLIANTSLPFALNNSGWHSAKVRWEGKTVSVSLDGTTIIADFVVQDFVPGTSYHFGFGASSWFIARDRHEIRNVTIAFPSPRCL